jgi:2-(1,2-epoxy-1,2-dihydrophenyl)acetyl-CoA isomerase
VTIALSPLVLTSIEDRVLLLTLNNPGKMNSLTKEMLQGLGHALEAAKGDDSVQVVVITGAGTNFCSGQNLAETDLSDVDVRKHLRDYYEPVVREIRELEKPVIASINGVAAGAGLSLALAADFRVAALSAMFVQAFVRVGLTPDAGSTYLLPRLVGWGRAMEMMMLGEPVDAKTALQIGMVNRVVDDDELATATHALAVQLAGGPRSQALIKRLLAASAEATFDGQLKNEANAQAEAAASSDFARGLEAFLGKRAPQFKGD